MRAPEINNQQNEGRLSTKEIESQQSLLDNANLADVYEHFQAATNTALLQLSLLAATPTPDFPQGGLNILSDIRNGHVSSEIIIPPFLK